MPTTRAKRGGHPPETQQTTQTKRSKPINNSTNPTTTTTTLPPSSRRSTRLTSLRLTKPKTSNTPIIIEDEPNPNKQKNLASCSTKQPNNKNPNPNPSTNTETSSSGSKNIRGKEPDVVCSEEPPPRLVGMPFTETEARQKWPHRYHPTQRKLNDDDDEEAVLAIRHYPQAAVDGRLYDLFDDVYVKGEDGGPDYIGHIVEFFETIHKEPYFTAQWFYRAEDTVIKSHGSLIDYRRLFYSDIRNDNPLECIVQKVKITRVSPNAIKDTKISSDFYCDMSYSLKYSTISNVKFTESASESLESSSTVSSEASCGETTGECKIGSEEISLAQHRSKRFNMTLLDLYSGCGAMSTGLCLGAAISDVNLVTKWAVDMNKYACDTLRSNHPETEVRNETADNFLSLLKEWEKLCKHFSLLGRPRSEMQEPAAAANGDNQVSDDESVVPLEEFEVKKLVGVCFGDPNENDKQGVHFKVRWKGYGPDDDTWEHIEGLGNCQEIIRDFVTNGYKMNILPLPGDVDVICGGPPCQGVSGFNRFRNYDAPLDDPKNQQLVVFMDTVNYLKPKYVLMENVVDILKFADCYLGRYATGRLVSMSYQVRLGIMAAGCYGLPQFRMRAFLWGAIPAEKLPQYPLPTHDVVVRGCCPREFESNLVAYDENQSCNLAKALCLKDAISDLPQITNYETRDEIPYGKAAVAEFQRCIRLSKEELLASIFTGQKESINAKLYDHRPLILNGDDYQRVCQIPKRKGANFRNLPGVLVGKDNKVEWDESVERVLLPSGKPLVPDYAMTFVGGTSSKPFGRLWWDETVPTVVTRAEPHNQIILHPEQDRVLSVRENARLQGFPDFYKLSGPVKERYIQVGNAVAIPVARVLGYALGLACQGKCDDEPLFTLPSGFPFVRSTTI